MYKLGFYHFEEVDDKRILLTNDLGRFVFLGREEFDAMRSHALAPDSCAYSKLRDNGFLNENTSSEYVQEWQDSLAQAKGCLFYSTQLFILALTTACNQRCIYCQAGRLSRTYSMSKEVCQKAIDIAFQSPSASITIEFQGGEPTLNPDALRFAIPYAKQVADEKGKQVQFAIVTNLTAPDPSLIDWLISEGVSISTSLDGHQALHDTNRPLVSDESAYRKFREGLDLCRTLSRKYGREAEIGAIQTTTRASLKHPKEIIDAYIDCGYHTLYVRPLTPLGCAADEWLRIGYSPKEYLVFYTAVLDELFKLCKSGHMITETTASLYLSRILNHESVGHTELRSPCGAAIGQMAINYDGQVYTCDEGRMLANMGNRTFCLGSVDDTYEQLVTSPVAHAACIASCIETLPFCSQCVYNPYCSVCPVVTYGLERDLVSHDPNGYKCQISKGILRYLIEKVDSASEEDMAILETWAR